jgi:hypothetical protein
MHPRLDARTLGQTHRFGFHGAPSAISGKGQIP